MTPFLPNFTMRNSQLLISVLFMTLSSFLVHQTECFDCPDLKTPKCTCETLTPKAGSSFSGVNEERGIITCQGNTVDEIFLNDYSSILIESNPFCQDDRSWDVPSLSLNEVSPGRETRDPKIKERPLAIGSYGPSQCSLSKLVINRTAITSLNETHFPNLYIDELRLIHNLELQAIEASVFNLSRTTLRTLEISQSFKVSVRHVISFASDFRRLEKLKLLLGIEVIDKFTFGRYTFSGLKELDLSNNGISKILDYAFYEMPNLKLLKLSGNNIHMIPPQMLTLAPPSAKLTNVKFSVQLDHNHLSTDMIDVKSLSSFLRPVSLDLSFNNLHTLPEKPFRTFLYMDSKNFVDVKGNPFVCDSSEISWIQKHVHYLNYSRGGLDDDVNTEFSEEGSNGELIFFARVKPDYSYYKIRDMICQNNSNVFAIE